MTNHMDVTDQHAAKNRRSLWLNAALGFAVGMLAAGSASSRVEAALVAPAATARGAAQPLLTGAVRYLRLQDGRRLSISLDGASVAVTSPIKDGSVRIHKLPRARINASLSVLPSGRVLVWGGMSRRGELEPDGLWFDPQLQTFEVARELTLSTRASHTATVLSDGRVLFMGGSANGSAAEIWDERSNQVVPLAIEAALVRYNHIAKLEADGRVRFIGGRDGRGRPAKADVLFDPIARRFAAQPRSTSQRGAEPPTLSATYPAAGMRRVRPDTQLMLRFSERMHIDDIVSANISLIGPGGTVDTQVVPVEDGRLAFVTPKQELFPDSDYSLLVANIRSISGKKVALIAIDFKTAALNAIGQKRRGAEPASKQLTTSERVAAGCAAEAPSLQPCRRAGQMSSGVWTPGRNNTKSRWRVPGAQPELMRADTMSLITRSIGITSVIGRIVRSDGVPVKDVEVSVGEVSARTDAAGNFTLYDAPEGQQELYVDGSTANRGDTEYGQFVVGLHVKRGSLTQVPYTMYLPRIAARDKVRISSPLIRDVVLTHPAMPGLQVLIPAGTVIRDRRGRLVTELALVPTPVNRAPFPVAVNYPMYFTIEPGGAAILGLTPESAKGIRVLYPNYDQHPVGSQADFWIYDPAQGWRVYGKGRVTSDGTRLAPERGVALHQTMGGSYSMTLNDPAPNEDLPPDANCCGSPGDGGAANAADPIDLKTGDFIHAETDIAIADVVPLQLSRHYRPRDVLKREFGLGTTSNFNYKMSPSTNTVTLAIPNGAVMKFTLISASGGGKWRQEGSTTPFSGATIEGLGSQGYELALRSGAKMRFHYQAPNQLLFAEDRFGNRTDYVYDAGLVSQITSPSGRYVSLQYDAENRIDSAQDSIGRVWDYDYDANGLLSKVTYPDTTFKLYTYKFTTLIDASCPPGALGGPCRYYLRHSELGNPLYHHAMESITDQRGHRMLFNEFEDLGYGWVGRVIKQTQADDSFFTIDYEHSDGASLGVLVTNPDGSKRRVVFGPEGYYPASDTIGYDTPLAQTHLFERNPDSGQIDARIDPLGRRTEFQYNDTGQVTQVTQMAGTTQATSVQVNYNVDGQVESVVDALSRTISMGYTSGCLTNITNSLQKVTQIVCNSQGQPVSVTDPLNKTTQFEYIGYDLAVVIDPLLRTTRIHHDTLGRVRVVEDPDGNTFYRQYDLMGRIEKTFDAAGGITEIDYDENGNVDAVLMPHGNGITYDYDELNRLTDRYDSLGKQEHWTFDAMGRVDTHLDRKLQLTDFDYDVLGRLFRTTYPNGGGVITAGFDAGDRMRTLVDSLSGTLSWDFDNFDRMTRAVSPQGTIDYDHDMVGRRIGMTVVGQPMVEYDYDDGDRLQVLSQGSEEVEFEYDDADRLTETVLPNGVRTSYAYNDASQVTGIAWLKPDLSLLGDLGYGYETSTGRLIAQTGSYASPTLPPATTGTNSFDDNHRQTAWNGQSLNYDDNGNLTFDGIRTYVWNGRNQLTQIHQDGLPIASFSYDALGRRYHRAEGGQATEYLYDGADAVQETIGSTVSPILTGASIDVRYARTDGGVRTYFLTDALGSTRALTNAAGNVVQRYDYTPYGETTQTATGFSNPFQYTGREKDGSGLYYYRARYYNAAMGRFIAEDPIGLAGGLNPYAYVGGNPVSYVDPMGLLRFAPWVEQRYPKTVQHINSLLGRMNERKYDGFEKYANIGKNDLDKLLSPCDGPVVNPKAMGDYGSYKPGSGQIDINLGFFEDFESGKNISRALDATVEHELVHFAEYFWNGDRSTFEEGRLYETFVYGGPVY